MLTPLLCAGIISGQSLVELAKKEKARREKAKGKKIQVVTNADLYKKDIKRAQPAPPPEDAATKESSQPPAAKKTPVLLSRSPAPQETAEEKAARITALQSEWEKAKDKVEELSQKMNMLWQAYYSQTDTTRKGLLQQQISLTHLQLLQASQEEEQLKTQLDELKKQE